MLQAGSKPTSHSSVLTGLAKVIYDANIAEGIIPPEAKITTTIGDDTFEEKTSVNQARVYKSKLNAWVIANSIISDFKANAEINSIPSIINSSLSSAIPIPNDGGASLKSTFSVALSSNTQKGTIS